MSAGIAMDLVGLVAEPGVLHDVQLYLHFSALADVSSFFDSEVGSLWCCAVPRGAGGQC